VLHATLPTRKTAFLRTDLPGVQVHLSINLGPGFALDPAAPQPSSEAEALRLAPISQVTFLND
jgi:hypothetical protein